MFLKLKSVSRMLTITIFKSPLVFTLRLTGNKFHFLRSRVPLQIVSELFQHCASPPIVLKFKFRIRCSQYDAIVNEDRNITSTVYLYCYWLKVARASVSFVRGGLCPRHGKILITKFVTRQILILGIYC